MTQFSKGMLQWYCLSLGLPLGLEAPVMTPNGVFFFSFLSTVVLIASKTGLGHCKPFHPHLTENFGT